MVEEEKDVKRAMEFLHECDLLKIEDILPFFPDFVTIDHFKVNFYGLECICSNLMIKFIWHYSNALVIFNRAAHPSPLPPKGNSGDYDFLSSKYLLKAPPCGDCSLFKRQLFPRQPAVFSFHGPFAYTKQTLGISPALLWQNFGQSPAHINGWGVGRGMVTND